jgi:hypothetical protein
VYTKDQTVVRDYSRFSNRGAALLHSVHSPQSLVTGVMSIEAISFSHQRRASALNASLVKLQRAGFQNHISLFLDISSANQSYSYIL